MASNRFQSLRTQYSSLLKRFISSPKNIEILKTISPQPADVDGRRPMPPDVLYVLDSSFNPPTLAHLRIANSTLEDASRPTTTTATATTARLLLLLATQNADKPSKPALFEDRLAMMELFAEELLSSLRSTSPTTTNASSGTGKSPEQLPAIDIGVTKKPYFVDKAAEIEAAGLYSPNAAVEQIHLTGYDTLIRIFDPKYYPPSHTLQPLGPFLSQHRLRVTLRPDSEWGTVEEQRAFLLHLAEGGREKEGGRREWARRIEFVEGKRMEDRTVSSTRARDAIQAGRMQELEELVPRSVCEYIVALGPYGEGVELAQD